MQKYTKTTSRTVAWLNRVAEDQRLSLAAPYQRNPVWSRKQQSALIETILLEYPIPELYMQDIVDSAGREQHVVVDGQQRVRAVMDYLAGDYDLSEENSRWSGMSFDDLTSDDKKKLYEYDFVVRQLPEMPDEQIRSIFQRINRTNVTLNPQELRHATYWGPFIKLMEELADLEFWEGSRIFSANDRRRMLDAEFVSELSIGYLNGLQNKKSKLEQYYQLYETSFDRESEVRNLFFSVLGELGAVLPEISKTRWKKKSDFYSLFLCLAEMKSYLPLNQEGRHRLRADLIEFGDQVDMILSGYPDQEDDEDIVIMFGEGPVQAVGNYARNVQRAASDLGSRRHRRDSILQFILPIFVTEQEFRSKGEIPENDT